MLTGLMIPFRTEPADALDLLLLGRRVDPEDFDWRFLDLEAVDADDDCCSVLNRLLSPIG